MMGNVPAPLDYRQLRPLVKQKVPGRPDVTEWQGLGGVPDPLWEGGAPCLHPAVVHRRFLLFLFPANFNITVPTAEVTSDWFHSHVRGKIPDGRWG